MQHLKQYCHMEREGVWVVEVQNLERDSIVYTYVPFKSTAWQE